MTDREPPTDHGNTSALGHLANARKQLRHAVEEADGDLESECKQALARVDLAQDVHDPDVDAGSVGPRSRSDAPDEPAPDCPDCGTCLQWQHDGFGWNAAICPSCSESFGVSQSNDGYRLTDVDGNFVTDGGTEPPVPGRVNGVPWTTAPEHIEAIADRMDLLAAEKRQAHELLANLDTELGGCAPSTRAAAAVYAASLLEGSKRTQQEVADNSDASTVAIRNAYPDLLDARGISANRHRDQDGSDAGDAGEGGRFTQLSEFVKLFHGGGES